MALFNVLLTLHLVGVVILVCGLAIEIIALVGARTAGTVAGLRGAFFAVPALGVLMPLALVFVVMPGVWMAFIADRAPTTKPWTWHDAWIVTGAIVVVLLTANAAAHLNRRFLNVRAAAALAPDGPVPAELATLATDPLLHYPGWAAVATVPAFLYMMVTHPDAGGAIGSSCGWVVIGFVAAKLLTRLSRRAPEPAAS